MPEWEITVDGDGDLELVYERSSNENERLENKTKTDNRIILTLNILRSMEIRAQSIFRPGHDDVEILYALSGDSYKVNMLHQFPIKDILYGSNAEEANVDVENMIAYIKAETGNIPGLLVILHTHPGGEPLPSTHDKLFFRTTAKKIKQHSPETKVFYGIHAISGCSVRAKKDYEKVNENKVKWSSITHDHEVAFYTKESKPLEVDINR